MIVKFFQTPPLGMPCWNVKLGGMPLSVRAKNHQQAKNKHLSSGQSAVLTRKTTRKRSLHASKKNGVATSRKTL